MNRQDYAVAHKDRYLTWCQNIADGPYTPTDKMEFAIITAHCPMAQAIEGFLATRGVTGLQALANALDWAGVMAPRHKAIYITELRDTMLPPPRPDYATYRRSIKWPGLGYSKLSFASCLIAPFDSSILCLDTHMLQLFGVPPDQVQKVYQTLDLYAGIEFVVKREADSCAMPYFAYQWAVWDWKRLTFNHEPPCDHSFLWPNGRTAYQAKMNVGL